MNFLLLITATVHHNANALDADTREAHGTSKNNDAGKQTSDAKKLKVNVKKTDTGTKDDKEKIRTVKKASNSDKSKNSKQKPKIENRRHKLSSSLSSQGDTSYGEEIGKNRQLQNRHEQQVKGKCEVTKLKSEKSTTIKSSGKLQTT